jgi:hypothetical protein
VSCCDGLLCIGRGGEVGEHFSGDGGADGQRAFGLRRNAEAGKNLGNFGLEG